MKRLVCVLFLVAAPAWADDAPEPPRTAAPALSLPAEKRTVPGKPVTIKPTAHVGGDIRWMLPDAGLDEDRSFFDLIPDEWLRDEKLAGQLIARQFVAQNPGKFRVWAVCASGSIVSSKAECVVIVEGPTPPVPPTPPGPGPGPTPPGPTPGPAPIPADGLHVLIVYESADLPKYPKDQQAILYGADIRSYLNSHCAPGSNGKAGWRVWDQNTPAGADEKIWADAMARKRDKLPWLVVSNPQKGGGYEGPLPATVADTMKLLTTYGGN